MDCGSTHIAYESADSEFSFDISTAKIRTQILEVSTKEKIDIYSEEIERITNQISVCQKELDDSYGNRGGTDRGITDFKAGNGRCKRCKIQE